MDISSNIRSKHVFATQNEGFKYSQWTLFNLTVLQTAESEVVEKYFDVFTFHEYGKIKFLKHNSEYVINALSLIFQHPSFDAHRNKNFELWSDNGGAMKSSALIVYLSELAGTRFASVSQKFFVKYHGKSICDRHFGNIARARYYSSLDIKDTDDLFRALISLSKEVFLEILDNPLGWKRSELKLKGIKEIDEIEDIRKEGEGITLKTKFLKVGGVSNEVEETTKSEVMSRNLFREKRKKT